MWTNGVVAAIGGAILLMKVPSAVVMFLAMMAFFIGIVMGTRPVGQICAKICQFVNSAYWNGYVIPSSLYFIKFLIAKTSTRDKLGHWSQHLSITPFPLGWDLLVQLNTTLQRIKSQI